MSNNYICEDCGENMVYCHGEKRKPYLRHYPGSKCSSNGGESQIHKLCKNYICEHLFSGNYINVTNSCGCKEIIRLEYNNCIVQEYRNGNEIYDIAILDSKKSLKKIIEVYHTHRQFRSLYFYEFKTDEIINDIENLVSYNESECLICKSNKREVLYLRDKLKFLDINPNCKSSHSFKIIGKLWEIALSGKTNEYTISWKFETNNKDYYRLISLKRCVECLCKLENQGIELYCMYCSTLNVPCIMNCNYTIKINMKQFQQECRLIFRKVMKTLDCGKDKYLGKCKTCNKNDSENFYTWWYDDENKYKYICCNCLYHKIKGSNYNLIYEKVHTYLFNILKSKNKLLNI